VRTPKGGEKKEKIKGVKKPSKPLSQNAKKGKWVKRERVNPKRGFIPTRKYSRNPKEGV